jgi:hypothetical protein
MRFEHPARLAARRVPWGFALGASAAPARMGTRGVHGKGLTAERLDRRLAPDARFRAHRAEEPGCRLAGVGGRSAAAIRHRALEDSKISFQAGLASKAISGPDAPASGMHELHLHVRRARGSAGPARRLR